eukprot:scaffold20949_cov23-Tisochrysis_lutea.AAC.1
MPCHPCMATQEASRMITRGSWTTQELHASVQAGKKRECATDPSCALGTHCALTMAPGNRAHDASAPSVSCCCCCCCLQPCQAARSLRKERPRKEETACLPPTHACSEPKQ